VQEMTMKRALQRIDASERCWHFVADLVAEKR
jgi:hypothetical protein